MTDLKPCPFCGGEAEYVTTQGIRSPWSMVALDALGTTVQCRECHATVPSSMSLDGAVEAWNARAERTCHDTNEDEHDFTCSECGASMYTQIDDCWTMIARGGLCADVIERPNFCPNCGAKVVGG